MIRHATAGGSRTWRTAPAALLAPAPAALLAPAPTARRRMSLFTAVGLSAWRAAVGTLVSALSSANSAVTMFLIVRATTPV
ncbi:hypothetical protein [Streptomyces sp. NPDC058466]|uniref:hypothetical protein n=1 Tax=Streptomyces sp. NPDC058466 TaxID=3346512 RepID=UPI00366066BD